MTTYAPAHYRILSTKQTEKFIATLTSASHGQDVEKTVEHAINELLHGALTTVYPSGSIVHDYRHNTDGYFHITGVENPYALLVEAKRDLSLSESKKDRATVYAQVCAYLRRLATDSAVPAVVVVCDNNEVFGLRTAALEKYVADDSYAWDEFSASTMYKDGSLLADLINDHNIQHPYVHDIRTGFDADMFIWSIDAMGQGSAPFRVPINKDSLDHVFTRFKMEVLGTDATGLKNKDEISLFIDILRGCDDIFPHPKKPNTLLWKTKTITVDTYRFEHFWAQYQVGVYTLDEIKAVTEIADTLIEETERRFTGDFWTPPRWVDKAHEYIEKDLGEDWKQRYVVWDPAAGALNLTRDYKFGELYSSTLIREELEIASDYNPEGVKFQYDFLNDDMILHDPEVTAEDIIDMSRRGELKMPGELVEALYANKPIVFFANPPYGQSGSGQGRNHKAGVNSTAVGELMDGMGHARMELYTQFVWRTKELAKVFGYTSDFHFFFFNKGFLTSPNFGKFVNELTAEFTYCDGFMLNAGEFSGTSSAWGVIFSHFEIGGASQREFTYTVLESNKDMSIDKLAEWAGRNVPRGETLSNWFREIAQKKAGSNNPGTKNGLEPPSTKTDRSRMGNGALGVLMQSGDTVAKSDKYIGLFTMGVAQGNGRDVTRDNFTRAAVTFSIRRSVQEVIAEKKLVWVRDKDIFTRPPEELLTPEFVADCVVYSLFDRQSNQTSLRDYEYQGKTYRVINEFFPFSVRDMKQLAQKHRNTTIEADITGETDRFVYQWLADHHNDLSEEAHALLNLAWHILKTSFPKRPNHYTIHPRFQLQTWDAGWKQINALVFGKNRLDNDVYNEYYAKWRQILKTLGDKIATQAIDAGVI